VAQALKMPALSSNPVQPKKQKQKRLSWAGVVTRVVEHLPSKHKPESKRQYHGKKRVGDNVENIATSCIAIHGKIL
jgi:hypothetical protein